MMAVSCHMIERFIQRHWFIIYLLLVNIQFLIMIIYSTKNIFAMGGVGSIVARRFGGRGGIVMFDCDNTITPHR